MSEALIPTEQSKEREREKRYMNLSNTLYSTDWIGRREKRKKKKNFANGRIIKGDSDHDASGTVHTITLVVFIYFSIGRGWCGYATVDEKTRIVHTRTLAFVGPGLSYSSPTP